MKDISVDVLIIGAGPAGLAAAIYTARACKKTLILKGKVKSHLEMAHKIANYPGIDSISGKDLLQSFENQALKFGAEIIQSEALELALGMDPKMVTTRDIFVTAKTVILAMGKGQHKKTVINEEDFIGRGVSYCASCDGAFYKGKSVVVYGNDEEAVDDALMLKQLGCKTKLVMYCGNTKCSEKIIDEAKNKGLEIITDTEILSVNGTSGVESISLKNKNGTTEMPIDALFIIQEIPSATLLKKAGINLTNKDCIDINRQMHSSLPGVFVAGDITCGGLQVAVAVGEGVTASLEALKYLRDLS
jgi:thioredoxin reductase (NADPH)